MRIPGWLTRRAWPAAATALLVALAGFVVAAGAGMVLAERERASAAGQVERRADLVAEAVGGETGRYIDTLRTVAAALGVPEPLTAAAFAQTTVHLTDMRLAGATSVAFLVPVVDGQTAAVEALWRGRGVPDLRLQSSSPGPERIFSIFSVPLDGATTPRYGIDVTRSAPAVQALTESRRTGQVAISDPYQLLIDRDLPADQRQLSFSLTMPVHGPPAADGQRPFRGWVLMGLRGRDFIGATLARAAQDQVDVTLGAPAGDGSEAVVATQTATVTGGRDLHRHNTITVANRSWRLDVDAVTTPAVTGLPGVVTAAGTLVGLLLAGLVYVLATGRARAQAGVAAATAGLAAAEAAARDQAALLTAILDSISDGVGVVDENGDFLLHNPAAKAILGVEDDRGGSDNWQEHYGIYAPDGRTPFPTADLPLVRALAGESTEQVELVLRNAGHPDGMVISVSGRPLLTADGRKGAVAVFHDITARKAAQARLAATTAALRTAHDSLTVQRNHLTQILDAVDITVLTCDGDGRIVHANRAARRVLPAGPLTVGDAVRLVRLSDADGRPVPLDRTPLNRALAGEHIDGLAGYAEPVEGIRRAVMLHARPLLDAEGGVVGAVAASYDVSALREREAELHAYAGVVAHDLKAPLTAVAGYAEILDDDLAGGAPPEALRESLKRVRQGLGRMRRLIDDLLTYATARDAPLRPEPVDLQALVAEVIAEHTAHLRTGTAEDGQPVLFPDIYTGPLPTVQASRTMMRQLLDNLIGNALKYTLPGQPARIDVSAHRRDGDGHVRVEIADRGIGIPGDEQPHVFTTFHRAAAHSGYTGTGLGLAICHRIVDRHGGAIAVADNPGGGTRVWFTLPAATPARPAVEPAADQPTH